MHEPIDVLVVGAGTAGCVLAARLSEDPGRQVLLLEAGPETANGDAAQWGLTATVCGTREAAYVRGRVLGGSGRINDGGLLRALPADFARWSQAGLPEWTWDAVLAAYCRLERDHEYGDLPFHGHDGPIPVTRAGPAEFTPATRAFAGALLESGQPWTDDMNAPGAVGVGPYPKNRIGAEIWSSARAYLEPARQRPNLAVRTSTFVDRVVVRDGRAIGVEAAGALIPADEVVLAAGAPLSPTLLLRSGIGPADELHECGIEPVADLPGVGRGLRDQPGAVVAVAPRDGVLTEDEPRHQVIARLSAFPGHSPDDAFYCCQFAGPPPGGGPPGLALMVGDLAPRSTGQVRLRSGHPSDAPRIAFDFYREEGDLNRMRSAVRYALDLTRTRAYAEVVGSIVHPDPNGLDDGALDRFLRAETFSRLATTGGAAMGDSEDSVVDHLLRVHGVDGLRVADLSIVPVPLRAPTAAEALMIGERAASLMGACPPAALPR